MGNFIPILKNGLTSMSISNIPELALIMRFLRTKCHLVPEAQVVPGPLGTAEGNSRLMGLWNG